MKQKDENKSMRTICGVDCSTCYVKEGCNGCFETGGHPFGGNCVVASCCKGKGKLICSDCSTKFCKLKEKVIQEFNDIEVDGMPQVTEIYQLLGSLINLEYILPGGQKVKFWKDEDVYLGIQLPKLNSDKCFGLIANEEFLMVCEYNEKGTDPHIVYFRRRQL